MSLIFEMHGNPCEYYYDTPRDISPSEIRAAKARIADATNNNNIKGKVVDEEIGR